MSNRARLLLFKGKQEAAKGSPAKASPSGNVSSPAAKSPRPDVQSPTRPLGPLLSPSVQVQTPQELPTLIVTSGDKVQQWLVSLIEGCPENDGPHKRKLFSGSDDKEVVSPTKKKRVAVRDGIGTDLAGTSKIVRPSNVDQTSPLKQTSSCIAKPAGTYMTAKSSKDVDQTSTLKQPSSCSAKPASDTIKNARSREQYMHRASKKISSSVKENSPARGLKKNLTPVKSNSVVRVSKRLISPVKRNATKTKKGAVGKNHTDWRKLISGSESLQSGNMSIVMEYNDDDLSAPQFFVEENVDCDDLQPLDLSPPKHLATSKSQVSSKTVTPEETSNGTKENTTQKTTCVSPAATSYHPVCRRKLNLNSNSNQKQPTDALKITPNGTSVIRGSRSISPAKDGTANKKGAAVSGGPSTDWRKLVPSAGTQRPEKLSFVMQQLVNEGTDDSNDSNNLAESNTQETGSCSFLNDSEGEEAIDPVNSNTGQPEEASLVNNNELTPPARKRNMIPKESKRKRSLDPSKWQRNVASKAFNHGTEYITTSGKLKGARVMKEPCSDKCNRCERKLSQGERETVFHKFWDLENLNRKRDFITRHIKVRTPDTISTSPECTKNTSRRYFLTVNGEEVRVCKTMFLNTLGVVDCWVETALKKCRNGCGLSPDKRGKHSNRPIKTGEDTIQSVVTHINLFPRVPSHYSRERSKREYLETELKSIERMYRLYKQWAQENNIPKPASASLYRKIFNTQFNLGFFLPKKDQCETCNKWRHASNQEERREIIDVYAAHLKNKKAVKELKANDLKSASETKCVACFDLQKVLICPRGETSIFFYKNKLSLFNFTVFDTRLSEGHCFLWTETDGHKGPNEIGTNLFNFIEKKVDEGIKEFSFYSDAPTGQNRNRMIFSMYLVASARFGLNICHRFLESGHSYSEADSMHARIEDEAKRKQEIFTPSMWKDLIKHAKQNGKPYIVSSLENAEILDLHYLVDRQNWAGDTKTKIYWSQVREIVVKSDCPNTVYFRYNFNEELSSVEIKMKAGRMPVMAHFQFPSAYSDRFPLPKNKADDIKEMLTKKAIPSQYREEFEQYLNI